MICYLVLILQLSSISIATPFFKTPSEEHELPTKSTFRWHNNSGRKAILLSVEKRPTSEKVKQVTEEPNEKYFHNLPPSFKFPQKSLDENFHGITLELPIHSHKDFINVKKWSLPEVPHSPIYSANIPETPPKPADTYGPPTKIIVTYKPPTTTEKSLEQYFEHHQIAEKPSKTYGVPHKPSETYGVPLKPSETYGEPLKPSETYGIPQKPSETYEVPHKPSETYQVSQKPSEFYDVPLKLSETYGVPQKLSETYDVPLKPSESYEVPQKPSETYRKCEENKISEINFSDKFDNYKKDLSVPIWQYIDFQKGNKNVWYDRQISPVISEKSTIPVILEDKNVPISSSNIHYNPDIVSYDTIYYVYPENINQDFYYHPIFSNFDPLYNTNVQSFIPSWK